MKRTALIRLCKCIRAISFRMIVPPVMCSSLICNVAFADERYPFLSNPQARVAFDDYLEHDEGDSRFKVFIVWGRGGYAWAARSSYELASKWAEDGCTQYVHRGKCKLYAVGETIVRDLKKSDVERTIAEYRSRRESGNPYPRLLDHPRMLQGFKQYQRADDFGEAKAFAKDSASAWSYRVRSSFEEAVEDAIEECQRYSKLPSSWGCRLFAVGDTVVWDMSDKSVDEVIAAYQNREVTSAKVIETSADGITLEKGSSVKMVYDAAQEHCKKHGKKSSVISAASPRYVFICR